jgi:hypothetical protein
MFLPSGSYHQLHQWKDLKAREDKQREVSSYCNLLELRTQTLSITNPVFSFDGMVTHVFGGMPLNTWDLPVFFFHTWQRILFASRCAHSPSETLCLESYLNFCDLLGYFISALIFTEICRNGSLYAQCFLLVCNSYYSCPALQPPSSSRLEHVLHTGSAFWHLASSCAHSQSPRHSTCRSYLIVVSVLSKFWFF